MMAAGLSITWGQASAGLIMAALAATHLLAGKLRFLHKVPRSRWLSVAGGASVAYVFVHIFPELSGHQRHLDDVMPAAFVERHVYFIALAGFALFYGLERLVKSHRDPNEPPESIPAGVFWVHVGAFGAYNMLIGYLLLHRETDTLLSLWSFGAAMLLHFLVNDYALHEHHRDRYRHIGRWLLAGATAAGFAAGLLLEVSRAFVAVLFAFLAGAVILNVIKEELPSERQSRFWAFAAGAAGYATVLLAS